VTSSNGKVRPSSASSGVTSTRSSSTRLQAVGSTLVKRVRDSLTSQERSREDLKIGIAGFYDRSSKLWEDVWGERKFLRLLHSTPRINRIASTYMRKLHSSFASFSYTTKKDMHHGYYIPEDRTDHKQAQIDLIDEVLKWAEVDSATKVVDVGCGIGGSSRHIARKYGASCEGVTLSPYQASRGNELAKEQGLSDTCHFQVADALDMPFADNTFDVVWSLESGEHMPDKQQFVNELFRVATPGGRIIIVTWCHRDLEEGETSLTKKEERLLRKINRAYYLPQWCSVKDYVDLLEAKGATDIKREDWSYIIAPFWKAVIRSSLNFKSVWGLLRSGFSTQRGAYAMFLMLRGFNQGLIKFGLLTCTKPTK